jgi:hypothetical protein
MGSPIWNTIGVAESKLAAWLSEATTAVTGIAAKAAKVFSSEKQTAPEIVAGVQTVFADLEALVAAGETATTGQGVNWTADSAAYNAYLKLVSDFKTLAPAVEAALKDLETL